MHPSDPIRRILATDFRPFTQGVTQGIDVQSLWKWVKLSVAVGALTGLLASLVYFVLEWSEATFFMRLAGHEQPAFGHLFDYGQGPPIWWLLILLPAGGGLGAGLILHFLDKRSGSGHDTNGIIDAFHEQRSEISTRHALWRVLASALTLGSGGSAGREGPMAYVGASFGTRLSGRFKLSARDRRLLMLAGAAGGISALFRTPLGAALFALEIIYQEDFETEGMFPVIVSSITAYSVFTSIYDTDSLFHVPSGGYEFEPLQLVFYGIMALAVAPIAVIWCKASTRWGPDLFARVNLPYWAKPALGGLVLGCLALVLPWVIGTGYGWIQDALLPTDSAQRLLPSGYKGFGILIAIAFAKMLATTLTLSSGGAGGVFAPTLFIGGFLGGAFGLLFHELVPGIITQPGAFVLVGMGAFYAGAAKAPLSTIIMISELFGSYDLLVPLMLAIVISILLLRHVSLFSAQVPTAAESPVHAARYTVDVLESLHVKDYFIEGRASIPVPSNMPLGDFLAHVSATAESFFVVENGKKELVGTVSLDHVRSVVSESEVLDFLLVNDAMTPLYSVAPGASLGTALNAIVENCHEYVPVVDPEGDGSILGTISQRQIAAEYNAEILRRRLQQNTTVAD
ncbi:MAG: chloride channel protein [Myxococcales bacterium]|nr:chloride channel protein [Myxococcales bacterium]